MSLAILPKMKLSPNYKRKLRDAETALLQSAHMSKVLLDHDADNADVKRDLVGILAFARNVALSLDERFDLGVEFPPLPADIESSDNQKQMNRASIYMLVAVTQSLALAYETMSECVRITEQTPGLDTFDRDYPHASTLHTLSYTEHVDTYARIFGDDPSPPTPRPTPSLTLGPVGSSSAAPFIGFGEESTMDNTVRSPRSVVLR